jgi:6-hydroxynicotinate reductase
VTCGGAPVYVWPGGGITLMVDVLRMPDRSFGYVPTPALVLPIEFTMAPDAYAGMGGHVDRVVPIERALREARVKAEAWSAENAWPAQA